MSITKLSAVAAELSSYVITLTFADENGDAVVPETISWSLVDLSGSVINSRRDVEIAIPAASVDVVLNGDDLVVNGDSATEQRSLIVKTTYTADSGVLNLNSAVLFDVLRLGILPEV